MELHCTTGAAGVLIAICATVAAQTWAEPRPWDRSDGSERSVAELAPFFPGFRPRAQCPAGWWLLLGHCEDVDECRDPNSRPCFGLNTVCRNTLGSYRCQCLSRHTGDPYSFSGCRPDEDICSQFTTTTDSTISTDTASTITTTTAATTTAATTTTATTTAATTTAATTTAATTTAATTTTATTTAATTTAATTTAATTTAATTTAATTTAATTTAATTTAATTTTATTTAATTTTATTTAATTTAATTTAATTTAATTTAATTTTATTTAVTATPATTTTAATPSTPSAAQDVSTPSFIVTFTTTTTETSTDKKIPNGYSRCLLNTENSTSFYRLVTNPVLSWSDADEFCRQDHPHAGLAKIASASVNNCLKTWFLFHTNVYYSWIGLSLEDGESGDSRFRWTDGTLAEGVYVNWDRNEPMNPSERRCVRLYSFRGFWQTDLCSNLHAFFCQITV